MPTPSGTVATTAQGCHIPRPGHATAAPWPAPLLFATTAATLVVVLARVAVRLARR
jgi:hypothetical protein